MRKTTAAVIGATLIALFHGAEASAQSVTERIPIPIEALYSCDGEMVVLKGECNTVLHQRTDKDGGLHIDAQLSCHATGTGPSNDYRFNWNAHQKFDSSECQSLNERTVSRERLISKGPSDNLFVTTTVIFSTTDDCKVDVKVEVEANCKG